MSNTGTPPTGSTPAVVVTTSGGATTPVKMLHPSKTELDAGKPSPRLHQSGAAGGMAAMHNTAAGNTGRSPRKIGGAGDGGMEGVSALVMPSASSVAATAGLITILGPDQKDSKSLAPSTATAAKTDANKPPQQLSNAGLQRFLKNHTVDELKQYGHTAGKIIELDATIEPLKGFEELFKHNILSAPVYDSDKKEYAGFLDVRDMVSSLVFATEKNTPDLNEALPLVMMTKEGRHFGAGLSSGRKEVITITTPYLARRNPFHAVKTGAKLSDVADILSKGHHRVPVVGADGRVVQIVSQSSVIQFLSDAIAAGKDADVMSDVQQTLGTLGIAHKRTICVPTKTLAIDAFKILDKYRISGLAIVGLNDALLAHTSGTDLKLFVLDKGRLSLNVPIMEYLKQIRTHRATPVDISFPTVMITPHDSMAKAIQKLAATRHHRIFVVEDAIKKKVCGVVALTDILRFTQHTPQQLSQIETDITTHGRVTTPSLIHIIERSTPLPSPKASPRPSPRASPHSSPRGSPKGGKRRLSLGREVGLGSLLDSSVHIINGGPTAASGTDASGGSGGSGGGFGNTLSTPPASSHSPAHHNHHPPSIVIDGSSAVSALAQQRAEKRGSKDKLTFKPSLLSTPSGGSGAAAAGLMSAGGSGVGSSSSGAAGVGLGGLKSILAPVDVPSTIIEPMTPVVEDAPPRSHGSHAAPLSNNAKSKK